MRRLYYVSIVALGLWAAHAEVIDRIAATVDNEVITSSRIAGEIRVTAFLNGEKPDFGPANRRRTADRLIEQVLVRHEMELTRYPQPARSEIEEMLKQVKGRLGGDAAFERELAAYGISAGDIEDALLRQTALLRFIDLRFRPEVQVQEHEVMQYYENVFLPEVRKKGITPEPGFEDARAQCEDALAAQLVDKRVDEWLKETRARSRITYEEAAFQ